MSSMLDDPCDLPLSSDNGRVTRARSYMAGHVSIAAGGVTTPTNAS